MKSTEIRDHMRESVIQARIHNLCIPVEYATARKLLELGVYKDDLWDISTITSFSGTCFYYPVQNRISAQQGCYMKTEDQIALETGLLPTIEAKIEYLRSIDYGSRGGQSNFY